ncbi:unnamed protein product [Cunninghamella blakesleeana]
MDSYTKHQIRSFKPIVLFHHEPPFQHHPYPSQSLHHYSFQYQKKYQMNENDVQFHKQKVNDMLQTNSKLWCELLASTKQWDHSHPNTLPPIQLPPIQVPLPSSSTSTTHSTSSSSSSNHYYDDQPMISPTSTISSSSSSPTSSSLTTPTSFTFSNNPLLSTSTSTSTTASSSSSYHESMSSNESSSPMNSPIIAKIHIDTLCLDQFDKPRRGNLPKPVTAILKKWLIEHCRNPYPTEEEKQALKRETQLTLNQISNWFINARRRTLPIILAKLNQQYPGIKARRRRRKRSEKTMNNNNLTSIQ